MSCITSQLLCYSTWDVASQRAIFNLHGQCLPRIYNLSAKFPLTINVDTSVRHPPMCYKTSFMAIGTLFYLASQQRRVDQKQLVSLLDEYSIIVNRGCLKSMLLGEDFEIRVSKRACEKTIYITRAHQYSTYPLSLGMQFEKAITSSAVFERVYGVFEVLLQNNDLCRKLLMTGEIDAVSKNNRPIEVTTLPKERLQNDASKFFQTKLTNTSQIICAVGKRDTTFNQWTFQKAYQFNPNQFAFDESYLQEKIGVLLSLLNNMETIFNNDNWSGVIQLKNFEIINVVKDKVKFHPIVSRKEVNDLAHSFTCKSKKKHLLNL